MKTKNLLLLIILFNFLSQSGKTQFHFTNMPVGAVNALLYSGGTVYAASETNMVYATTDNGNIGIIA